MRRFITIMLALIIAVSVAGCEAPPKTPTSDEVQKTQQEKILAEGTAQVGMPGINNFRERKILKEIYELRDQTGLVTYTYVWSELNGKLIFFCNSIGYGIPYSTQFTNPQKIAYTGYQIGVATLPQADPNGLFSPQSAEGTWVMCKNPHGDEVRPVYVEPRVIVSQFKLD